MNEIDDLSVITDSQRDPKLNLDGYFSENINCDDDEEMTSPPRILRNLGEESETPASNEEVRKNVKSPFRKMTDDKDDYSVTTEYNTTNKKTKTLSFISPEAMIIDKLRRSSSRLRKKMPASSVNGDGPVL